VVASFHRGGAAGGPWKATSGDSAPSSLQLQEQRGDTRERRRRAGV
jgi:hypothetical protein